MKNIFLQFIVFTYSWKSYIDQQTLQQPLIRIVSNHKKWRKTLKLFYSTKKEKKLINKVTFSCITLIHMSHKIQQHFYYYIFISLEGSNAFWAQLFMTEVDLIIFSSNSLRHCFNCFINVESFLYFFIIVKSTWYFFMTK